MVTIRSTTGIYIYRYEAIKHIYDGSKVEFEHPNLMWMETNELESDFTDINTVPDLDLNFLNTMYPCIKGHRTKYAFANLNPKLKFKNFYESVIKGPVADMLVEENLKLYNMFIGIKIPLGKLPQITLDFLNRKFIFSEHYSYTDDYIGTIVNPCKIIDIDIVKNMFTDDESFHFKFAD